MGDLLGWLKGQLDRALAVAAAVFGGLCVFFGWFGASGATLTTEQIPYLASGAVGGLFALGVAATLWLSADMRDEWRKLDDVYQLMQDDRAARADETPALHDDVVSSSGGDDVRAVAEDDAPRRGTSRNGGRPVRAAGRAPRR